MDDARKKLRVCLICVVMAAVVVGLIYYFNDMRSHGKINEGTLVENSYEVQPKGENWQGSGYAADGMRETSVQESRA